MVKMSKNTKENRQMNLSNVINSKKVVSFRHLFDQVDCSEITLRKDIEELGGMRSYTHQRSFITLKPIPKFDKNGIWVFRKVGFTKHGSSLELILNLINSSKEGLTREELEGIVRIKIFQQIQVLLIREELHRVKIGNKYVYLPKDVVKNQRKMLKLVGTRQTEQRYENGLSTRDLIEIVKVVLLEANIKTPVLKKWIEKYSLKISVGTLEKTLLKYQLNEKKTH
jgi:hypothetical protein